MHEIDQLFHTLINKNGSDLHLEEGQKPKIRIHGNLVEIGIETLTHEKMTALLSLFHPKKIGKDLKPMAIWILPMLLDKRRDLGLIITGIFLGLAQFFV